MNATLLTHKEEVFWLHQMELANTAQVFLPSFMLNNYTPQPVIDRAYLLKPSHSHQTVRIASLGKPGFYPVYPDKNHWIAQNLEQARANGYDFTSEDPELVAQDLVSTCPDFEGEETIDLIPGVEEWQYQRRLTLTLQKS